MATPLGGTNRPTSDYNQNSVRDNYQSPIQIDDDDLRNVFVSAGMTFTPQFFAEAAFIFDQMVGTGGVTSSNKFSVLSGISYLKGHRLAAVTDGKPLTSEQNIEVTADEHTAMSKLNGFMPLDFLSGGGGFRVGTVPTGQQGQTRYVHHFVNPNTNKAIVISKADLNDHEAEQVTIKHKNQVKNLESNFPAMQAMSTESLDLSREFVGEPALLSELGLGHVVSVSLDKNQNDRAEEHREEQSRIDSNREQRRHDNANTRKSVEQNTLQNRESMTATKNGVSNLENKNREMRRQRVAAN